jgi:hypothetical protein
MSGEKFFRRKFAGESVHYFILEIKRRIFPPRSGVFF